MNGNTDPPVSDQVQRDAKFLEAKFSGLVESLPDAIVLANAAGHIVLANSQAEQLFGYGPGELRGHAIEDLMPERYRRRHLGQRAEYSRQTRIRPMGAGLDLNALRKDGTEFPVDISLSPVQTDEGTFVMSAIRDISERKRVERELQANNAKLEAANHQLDSFAHSISHDLHAPLRAIKGFAKILSTQFSDNLPAEAQELLDRVRINAARMAQLVDGLLAFARSGQQPLVKSVVEPEPIVRRVLDDLRTELADRDIQIDVRELPPCEADPTLLQQVFANLISNAVKYTRGRKPAQITVGAREEAGGLIYSVQDNGAGFDMAYAAKLFQVFQRLHTISEFEGSGVGLAIVHRIVQRHGGRVWAEGRVGHGASFHFTLQDAAPPSANPPCATP